MSSHNYDENLEEYARSLRRHAGQSEALRRWVSVIAIMVVVCFVGWGLFMATPDPWHGHAVAQKAGLTETRVIDSGFLTLRCSQGDTYYYRVRAKNPRNEVVQVTVCCGIFKDCTVRY